MPTATCFGTKVPSSGSLSATKDRQSNTYFRPVALTFATTIQSLKTLKLWIARINQYMSALQQQQQRSASSVDTSAATDPLWAVHTNNHTNMWPWGISYDASLWIIPWTYDPVADKLPEDDTLMPKHAAVGTECVVHFVISFIVLWLVHFVGLKYGMKENTPYE